MRNKDILICLITVFYSTVLCYVPYASAILPICECFEVVAGVDDGDTVWYKAYDKAREEWVKESVWLPND